MDKETFKQAIIELANEMENECGDWQNLIDTQEDKLLRERIIEQVLEKENLKNVIM